MYLKLSNIKVVYIRIISIAGLWDVCMGYTRCEFHYSSYVRTENCHNHRVICVQPTRVGEKLSHPLWKALLAGREGLEQAFQTQKRQAGPLLLLSCILYHAGDVGVLPHEHTGRKKMDVCFDMVRSNLQYKPKEL